MNGYIQFVLQNIPRLLSNMDRRPQSPTYGCADRNYWHYKIVDFPCGMLQETCLTLAQLYSIDFEGNIYHDKEVIRDLSTAIIDYCLKIQKKDGSFDEFFPNEHSFSPTAFNLYAVCMAYRILKLDEPRIIEHAQKSARFLLNYGHCGASNQEVAAVAGIYCYHSISGDDSVLKGLDLLLEGILESQSREGWMPEYQGPDIGYQSIALGYMTDYYRLSQDQRVKDSIDSMIKFLGYFVHPDGSVGGEYGSRYTSYLAPHGFELNGKTNHLAARIAKKVFLEGDPKVNTALDDRYICHFLLPSYLAAIEHFSPAANSVKLPCEGEFEKYFSDSNIFIKSTGKYYSIFNLQKGGCFKLYSKEGDSLSDSGYIVCQPKTLAINNWIDFDNKVVVTKNTLEVEGAFHKMMNRVPTPFWHFALRLVTFFLGKRVLPFLKKHLILRDKPIGVKFKRVIEYNDINIRVTDKVFSTNGKVFDLYEAGSLSYRYVAPTNYFSTEELSDFHSKGVSLGKNLSSIYVEKTININPLSLSRRTLNGS